MSSALLYQWMFLRLSKRFTLPFVAAAAVLTAARRYLASNGRGDGAHIADTRARN